MSLQKTSNFKFIDDGFFLVKINMRQERLLYQEGRLIKCIQDTSSQAMFDHVVKETAIRGMLANASKTALMCFSAATTFHAGAILRDADNAIIPSNDSMKVLGYTFDKEAGPSEYVKNIVKNFRSRTWALAKLKKADFSTEELIKLYKIYVRPLAEYVSVL